MTENVAYFEEGMSPETEFRLEKEYRARKLVQQKLTDKFYTEFTAGAIKLPDCIAEQMAEANALQMMQRYPDAHIEHIYKELLSREV